jgi:uncharacterized SAM-binding protein YcdF (DUF218 family)
LKFRARIGWLALPGLVVLAIVFHSAIFTALGNYLVQAGPPHKADIAVVLAGDSIGNRILKAAALVRDGYAPKLVVSGPAGDYGSYECDLAIPFAEKNGYPESYFIHAEHNARSTKEEADALIPVLRKLGAHSVLLVTSDFHTRRSGKIFRAAAPDMTFYVVAAPDAYFTPDGWWRNREGRKVFAFEWMKTFAEWIGL